jgi:TonB family protein
MIVLAFLGTSTAQVQPEDSQNAPRKIRSLVKPEYSSLARRMNLSGVVKIEVTIAPGGKVKRTRVLGGHPLLAMEAEKAASQTEFEPGPRETNQVMEFKFGS